MYVLSIISPPQNGAAFGKAVVLDQVRSIEAIRRRADYILQREYGTASREATEFSTALARKAIGSSHIHTGTDIAFRIDSADQAPHPCPCCERLVLPTAHPYAYAKDAFCLGCFTWSRDVAACLPENTAHSHTEN